MAICLLKDYRVVELKCEKDPYKILGVSKDTSDSEIKKVYKKLSLKHHPDKHKEADKKYHQDIFLEIVDAYDVLSNKELKSCYIYQCKGSENNQERKQEKTNEQRYSYREKSKHDYSEDWFKKHNTGYKESYNFDPGNKKFCTSSYTSDIKLECANDEELKIWHRDYDANTFASKKGDLFAEARMASQNYFKVKDSNCKFIAEIKGDPAQFTFAQNKDIRIEHQACRSKKHIGKTHKSANSNTVKDVIKNLHDEFMQYHLDKHNYYTVFNEKGDVVADIVGDPAQFNADYLGAMGDVHFAHHF
ncbi:Chaperone protein DnaJ [Candidatus Arcanobacter lacustris]|uniref:Chaperone protein DnaJ n=1 Tax=Candidatus Arcanibacter lacustris TaxID=1607817 RepID=A0A0F5MNT5_9RICK|nr:Chaperone protein DnaJ [Candidatus Arcanobacter lacustris]